MNEGGTKPMDDPDDLTDRQRRYVQYVASGTPSRQAAELVGYSKSFSKVIGHRLKNHPAVKQAMEAIRSEGMKAAVYDLATAMTEAEDVIEFAKQHKNSMAYMKAVELRSKLSGLLIDRVEVVAVDLTGALARAEARVLSTSNGASDLLPAKGSIDWQPIIPGNPEPGSADGQVRN